MLGEIVRRGERFVHHRAPRHERDVGALARGVALIERRSLAVVRHFLLDQAVEPCRLQKHDGIGVAYRGQQQAVGAARR